MTSRIMRPYRSNLLDHVGMATFKGQFSPVAGDYQQTEIERATARYASWGMPELVEQPATQGNTIILPGQQAEESIPAPEMTLQTLVRNRLDAQRKLFEHRAWEVFRDGHYRDACSYLNLAASAVLDDPGAQAYYKVAQVYAGIAAQEYAQALAALHWMVAPDRGTGEYRDAGALNSFRDVQSRYGAAEDHLTHNRELETFLARSPLSVEGQALRAMVAWGQGDRANAMFLARQAASGAEAESDWARLPVVLQQAEEARRLEVPAAAGTPSPSAPEPRGDQDAPAGKLLPP